MRLSELDPKLTPTQLRFTCPQCGRHAIAITLGSDPRTGWVATGTIENLNVVPSIKVDSSPVCHWHGHVRNGEIVNEPDCWNKPVDPVTGVLLP